MVVVANSLCLVSTAQDFQDQGQIRRYADSLERVKMRDSLGVKDETITQVFKVRDSMLTEIAGVRSENEISRQEQDERVKSIQIELNSQIRQILGEGAYNHYITMIRNRLRLQNKEELLPLAGENTH
jgi:hypothetical protein